MNSEAKSEEVIIMSKFRLNKKKIIITGGDGRFANVLKKINSGLSFVYPNKKELNILDFIIISVSISYLCEIKFKSLIFSTLKHLKPD